MAQLFQAHPYDDPLAVSFATTYAGVVAFIAVVTEGNFARAANRLGIGRSAVSRNVQKLEAQLNVRLLRRTTRATTLTREGDFFYSRCHKGVDGIVAAIEEMRDMRDGAPRGHLRICSAAGFGRRVIAPLLHEFREMYEGVSIDLVLNDLPIDFTTGHVDVAFLEGRLADSQIVARRIMPMGVRVYGSPAYYASHGVPDRIEDLIHHDCINLRLGSGRMADWEFNVEGAIRRLAPDARITYNDPELVLQAVMEGGGLAQLPAYLAAEPMALGALVSCLERYATDDNGHYICYQSRQHMPSRTRAFIDFMCERIGASAQTHALRKNASRS